LGNVKDRIIRVVCRPFDSAKPRSRYSLRYSRRGTDIQCQVRWVGFSVIFFDFDFHFFLPLRFMMAMLAKSSKQKKTGTELFGRRSSTLARPSDSLWFFKSLHFVTPNHQALLYHNGPWMSSQYKEYADFS